MRNHPHWLQGYVHHTRFSEAPDVFHIWTGVSTLAGAVRRQVWMDQRYFQWTPNFYIILVAPPGIATKSVAMGCGIDILRKLGDKLGPSAITWQALHVAMENARTDHPTGEGDYLTMSPLTCAISELGTFLRPSDREMLDLLVDLWDSKVGVADRMTKTQGETAIINPWLNVIGCTTPAWLNDNFPEVMVGGGFASRIVFVYGGEKRQYVPYPGEEIQKEPFEAEQADLAADLEHIRKYVVGEFKLSPSARTWGEEWYHTHWKGERPAHLAGERFSGYIARKQTHLHKLAIILSVAQRDGLELQIEDLQNADQLLAAAELSMARVFQSIGVAQTNAHTTEVLNLLLTLSPITDRSLWQKCMANMSPNEFTVALESAQKAGYLTYVQKSGGMIYEITKEGRIAALKKDKQGTATGVTP